MTTGRQTRVVVAQPVPDPPASLPALGHDVWCAVASELAAKGLLTGGVQSLIESYASTLVTIRQCQADIAKRGAFFPVRRRPPTPHPGLEIIAEAEKRARLLAARLGIVADSQTVKNTSRRPVRIVDGQDDFGDDEV